MLEKKSKDIGRYFFPAMDAPATWNCIKPKNYIWDSMDLSQHNIEERDDYNLTV